MKGVSCGPSLRIKVTGELFVFVGFQIDCVTENMQAGSCDLQVRG